MQNSVPFLYTNNRQSEKEIRETYLSQQLQKVQNLGVNLMKEVTNLYIENYKLQKEVREDITRWKDIPFSWMGRINIVKWLYQNSNDILRKDRKVNPKVPIQAQKTQNTKGALLELSKCQTSNYIQSPNNKDSMVWTQKQTRRPME
jgi:hypothetical protein